LIEKNEREGKRGGENPSVISSGILLTTSSCKIDEAKIEMRAIQSPTYQALREPHNTP
jgi:hypothetical protein